MLYGLAKPRVKNQAKKISIVHDIFNSTNDKKIKYEVNLKNLNLIRTFNKFHIVYYNF